MRMTVTATVDEIDVLQCGSCEFTSFLKWDGYKKGI
jgi:hypothetical protein